MTPKQESARTIVGAMVRMGKANEIEIIVHDDGEREIKTEDAQKLIAITCLHEQPGHSECKDTTTVHVHAIDDEGFSTPKMQRYAESVLSQCRNTEGLWSDVRREDARSWTAHSKHLIGKNP